MSSPAPHPRPRPRPLPRRAIAGVGEPAAIEREAAAADALGEARFQPPELGDPLADPRRPARRERRPVGPLGHAVVRQRGELGPDLLERQPDLLREDDEGDAPEHGPRVAAVPGVGADRPDQPLLLVEPQRRGRDPAARRHLADGEHGVHTAVSRRSRLTSSALEVRSCRQRGGIHEGIESSGHRHGRQPRPRRRRRARAGGQALRPGRQRAQPGAPAGDGRGTRAARRTRRGRCGGRHRRRRPREDGRRRARARRARRAREQRVRAGADRPAARLRPATLRAPVPGQCGRAARADPAHGAAAGGAQRADRQRHERRRARRVCRVGPVRGEQGGARAADAHARRGAGRPRRIGGDRRSGRHADTHASGGVSRRRHLGSAAARGDRAVLELAVRSAGGRRQRRTIRGAGRRRAMAAAGVIDAFELPAALEAHEPPEARGLRRDEVRLLVSNLEHDTIEHARFTDLPRWLAPGDLLVVNTSATLNAALPATADDGRELQVHLSTRLPGGLWRVELRRPGDKGSQPYADAFAGIALRLPAGGRITLLAPYPFGGSLTSRSRLWTAAVEIPGPVEAYLQQHGRPIRYGYVPAAWPNEMYQTVFADEPGSAEMPSAGRPFTPELVARLVTRGVGFAPIVLHTGVASLESHEPPYAEYYRVPRHTADRVNAARRAGGQVIAVGTTVVRALETVTDDAGTVSAGRGWTDLVVTPDRSLRSVTGLITGLHEPRATHLMLLDRVVTAGIGAGMCGPCHLERAYAEARRLGYLWHEFGDSHLIVSRVSPAGAPR